MVWLAWRFHKPFSLVKHPWANHTKWDMDSFCYGHGVLIYHANPNYQEVLPLPPIHQRSDLVDIWAIIEIFTFTQWAIGSYFHSYAAIMQGSTMPPSAAGEYYTLSIDTITIDRWREWCNYLYQHPKVI